jgi:translation initiation factor RLI1
MSGDGIPEYLREYLSRGSRAMEDISTTMKLQGERYIQLVNEINAREDQWADLIRTLNSDFALHSQNTEMKIADLCKALGETTKEATTFRTETWDWGKRLIERLILLVGGILATVLGAGQVIKFFLGG